MLEGSQDKRAFGGLKRSVMRLLSSDDTIAQGTILSNYHRQLQAASLLAPKAIKSTPDEEVDKILEMLRIEGYPLPERLKQDILMRKVGRVMRDKRYAEVLGLLAPWEQSVWDYKQPTLAGLTADPSKRVSLFRKHLLVDVMLKLLLQGKEGSEAMIGLTQQALVNIDAVDMVSLDASCAVAVDESTCIFKSMLALLTPTLDTSLEDRGL